MPPLLEYKKSASLYIAIKKKQPPYIKGPYSQMMYTNSAKVYHWSYTNKKIMKCYKHLMLFMNAYEISITNVQRYYTFRVFTSTMKHFLQYYYTNMFKDTLKVSINDILYEIQRSINIPNHTYNKNLLGNWKNGKHYAMFPLYGMRTYFINSGKSMLCLAICYAIRQIFPNLHIVYVCNGNKKKHHTHIYSKIEDETIENITNTITYCTHETLLRHYDNKKPTLIVLDDYVMTGDTSLYADLLKMITMDIPSECVYVLCNQWMAYTKERNDSCYDFNGKYERKKKIYI